MKTISNMLMLPNIIKTIINIFKILFLLFIPEILILLLFKVVIFKGSISVNLNLIINLISHTILIILFSYLTRNNKEYYKIKLKSIFIILSAIIITLVLNAIMHYFFIQSKETNRFDEIIILYKSANKLLIILYIIIFGPIEEELFFRKLIFTYLENRKFALIFSIILFAFAHSVFDLKIFIIYLPASIIISLIYYKTNSVKMTSLFHILFNSLAVIKYLIAL
ncbi:CPBP family intramembrane glutamic endopeptidase [Streptobacillus moniliformis]|uniref:CPBP family intramembrane glutamic endopeptidase n=1 Tax=Streptobacillus moniliformis TaxID=34105 RepID=UPI0007E449E6|nr:type II CAAX endopeptidase family protein [Streptobacillus moniliformis]